MKLINFLVLCVFISCTRPKHPVTTELDKVKRDADKVKNNRPSAFLGAPEAQNFINNYKSLYESAVDQYVEAINTISQHVGKNLNGEDDWKHIKNEKIRLNLIADQMMQKLDESLSGFMSIGSMLATRKEQLEIFKSDIRIQLGNWLDNLERKFQEDEQKLYEYYFKILESLYPQESLAKWCEAVSELPSAYADFFKTLRNLIKAKPNDSCRTLDLLAAKIDRLDLGHLPFSTIVPLRSLTHLKVLDLSHVDKAPLYVLSFLRSLTYLDISFYKGTSVPLFLKPLSALQTLLIDDTSLNPFWLGRSLFLLESSSIERLSLANQSLDSLFFLEAQNSQGEKIFRRLRELKLRGNPIRNFEPRFLEAVSENLETLDMSRTMISSLDVHHFPRLILLNVRMNPFLERLTVPDSLRVLNVLETPKLTLSNIKLPKNLENLASDQAQSLDLKNWPDLKVISVTQNRFCPTASGRAIFCSLSF